MLGPARTRVNLAVAVSRGDLVLHEHFSHRLEATLNLSIVRDKPRELYAERGRIVHQSLSADYLVKVRNHHTTEAYKKAVRKRQVWVEPLFAEAKDWHGLRRLRLRGLVNANIQGLLIAAGQNLKRSLAASGWGRRHAPYGSLVALLTESGRLSAVSM